MRKAAYALALGLLASPCLAQQSAPTPTPEPTPVVEEAAAETGQTRNSVADLFGGIKIGGYAIANYYAYDFDTYAAKNEIDLERVILEFSGPLTDKIDFEIELEVEGGGTGVTLELDRFEEFGEFETEVEHGGEVVIEEVNLTYYFTPGHSLVFGHQIVQFGEINRRHRPRDYFTNARPEMETNMIPTAWAATGIGLMGVFEGLFLPQSSLGYSLQFIQGLDSTRFSSARFVADGQSNLFERSVAEDFALAASARYFAPLGDGGSWALTLAGYFGNSANNRPKNDLASDANVLLLEAHLGADFQGIRASAQYLMGEIQNSAKVTTANKNLSNALGAPRTAVASEASGFALQAGYDLFDSVFDVTDQQLTPFVRYEDYDTMRKAASAVFDNPRYARKVLTLGVNWQTLGGITAKASYALRELGNSAGGSSENTFALGFGVQF